MTKTDKQVEELFNAGAHFGHKTNRLHPQAKKYIYKTENGISIIDLTKTVERLNLVKEFIDKLGAEGKTLLVVATKRLAGKTTAELCQKNNIYYLTTKWPAGLLTNFEMILKNNLKKLQKMREEKQNSAWEKFVKHEQVKLQKELHRLERFYGGIADLGKLPDCLFVIDIKREKNAVLEAKRMGIPLIAVTDTNVNPDLVDYPIPANDDSQPTIEYLVKELVETYVKHRKT